jgi:hypothetical protein
MVGTNDGVAFRMTDLLTTFNVRRALAKGPAVGGLPSTVSSTGLALYFLHLAAKVFSQVASLGLVCVHVMVKRLMAHTGKLLATCSRLHCNRNEAPACSFTPGATLYALRLCSDRSIAVLLGAVAARACTTAQLASGLGPFVSDQAGDLRDAVLGFHRAGDLVSFNLAEVFVIHRATSACKSGSLE